MSDRVSSDIGSPEEKVIGECAELIQSICTAQRLGWGTSDPAGSPENTNARRAGERMEGVFKRCAELKVKLVALGYLPPHSRSHRDLSEEEPSATADPKNDIPRERRLHLWWALLTQQETFLPEKDAAEINRAVYEGLRDLESAKGYGHWDWQQARKEHKCERGCRIVEGEKYATYRYGGGGYGDYLKFCKGCVAMMLYLEAERSYDQRHRFGGVSSNRTRDGVKVETEFGHVVVESSLRAGVTITPAKECEAVPAGVSDGSYYVILRRQEKKRDGAGT